MKDIAAGLAERDRQAGDSFVVAFTRASKAVACTLELQLAPSRLRIGLDTRGGAAAPFIVRARVPKSAAGQAIREVSDDETKILVLDAVFDYPEMDQ